MESYDLRLNDVEGRDYMVKGKFRPLWVELITAVVGIVLVLAAPIRIGWIGTALIAISVVSVIVTFVMPKRSSKVQIVGLIIGIIAVAAGLFIGTSNEDEATIFSPALIWVVGAGLMMSTLVTLVAGKMQKNPDDPL